MDAKVPPTAIILRDPGHTTYSAWDLKLVAAYHIYEDLMRGNVPVYWDESDRVAFDVKTGISKSRRAIELKQERDASNKNLKQHGMYYYAVPRVIDGGTFPTLEEWIEERARKQGVGDKRPGGPASPLIGLDGLPLQS